MKYVLIVPDGAADRPCAGLQGKTPLEAADTPHMDEVAREGLLGTTVTIPEGMDPGSDVANLAVLGYDPRRYHTGRAPLEAPALGVTLKNGELAFRCNLVTVADGILTDYAAGHIPSEESKLLIEALNETLGDERVTFHPGVSYRHLMVLQDGAAMKPVCTPPHDITGKEIAAFLPRGPGSELLNRLMEESAPLLAAHEVNRKRAAGGANPATMIWLWGYGTAPSLPAFDSRFNVTGAVISAVDLVRSIGHYIGFDVIEVEGATGYYDTNYGGKADAAARALEDHDFVFVHVEAPDEAGHNADTAQKVTAIEAIDRQVVGPLLATVKALGDARMLVMPDHATPLEVKTHTVDPVPFAMFGTGVEKNGGDVFTEAEAAAHGTRVANATELMPRFIGK